MEKPTVNPLTERPFSDRLLTVEKLDQHLEGFICEDRQLSQQKLSQIVQMFFFLQ